MSEQQRKVLVFTAGDYTTASSKYRAFLLGRYLAEARADIEWSIVEPSTKVISAMGYRDQIRCALRQAKRLFWRPQHDVVFMQRAIYNKFVFLALLIQNLLRIRPSIFDLDDAIFTHSPWKTRLLVKTSSAVMVGSHHLYEYARRYTENVTLVPTCIKYSDYAHVDRTKEPLDYVTIGWLGNAPAYLAEVRFLAETLRDLYTRNPHFRLLFIGAHQSSEVERLFDFLPPEKKTIIAYVDAKTDADLVPYLSKMDIGLMPLLDNEWNKGKCALKAIQYMATGAAVVASPVGENAVLITHRESGMLARTEEEWVACLDELIKDSALRKAVGVAGRARVRELYSFESQCPAVYEVIRSIV